MLLDLSNQYEKNKFQTYSKDLLEKSAKVELKEVKNKRTTNQNSYLHAILCIFGIEHGNTLQEVKDLYFKIEANREIFVKEHISESAGLITTYLRSSADLDTSELTTAIERFRNWSAEKGFYIMSSDEFLENHFAIMQEINRNKTHI